MRGFSKDGADWALAKNAILVRVDIFEPRSFVE